MEAVVDWVPEGSGVCELYAGVGVLGLNVAAKAAFVRCSDVNSFNPRSFEKSRWGPVGGRTEGGREGEGGEGFRERTGSRG